MPTRIVPGARRSVPSLWFCVGLFWRFVQKGQQGAGNTPGCGDVSLGFCVGVRFI